MLDNICVLNRLKKLNLVYSSLEKAIRVAEFPTLNVIRFPVCLLLYVVYHYYLVYYDAIELLYSYDVE